MIHFDSSAFIADPDLVHQLEKRSSPVPCDTVQVLFRQGDPAVGLYILVKGEVSMIMVSEQGTTVAKLEAYDGSLLGLPGLIGNQPYSMTATARAGSAVSFITRDSIMTIMESEATVALKILEVLAAEVRSARMALSSR